MGFVGGNLGTKRKPAKGGRVAVSCRIHGCTFRPQVFERASRRAGA